MGVACEVPTSKLVDRPAGASNASTFKGGGVNRDRLPALFETWCKTSWGDLLEALPDEDNAPAAPSSAGCWTTPCSLRSCWAR
jgi:hypothetical protein